MRLYAIKDRLVDYYMRPFTANEDKEVLASVAQGINQGDENNAISQTPHHFEVWRLADIDEAGDVWPNKELLADCSSLLRGSVRTSTDERANALHRAPGGQPRSAGQTTGNASPGPGAPQGAPQAEDQPGGETPPRHPGGVAESSR